MLGTPMHIRIHSYICILHYHYYYYYCYYYPAMLSSQALAGVHKRHCVHFTFCVMYDTLEALSHYNWIMDSIDSVRLQSL